MKCPNCGETQIKKVRRNREKIIFYNCTRCDFSSFDKLDFKHDRVQESLDKIMEEVDFEWDS